MERQINLLTYLVDDLINIGRNNDKNLDIKPESVILQSVIEEAINTCTGLPKWKQQKLEVDIPSRPIYLDADPLRLLQVFNNLLNNASKYTPLDGLIRITAEREYNKVVVIISDTGIGIAPDRLRTVFESPWAEQDSENSPCGAGLILVNRLVEMHKGSIEARSEGPGTGCQIIVRLPII